MLLCKYVIYVNLQTYYKCSWWDCWSLYHLFLLSLIEISSTILWPNLSIIPLNLPILQLFMTVQGWYLYSLSLDSRMSLIIALIPHNFHDLGCLTTIIIEVSLHKDLHLGMLIIVIIFCVILNELWSHYFILLISLSSESFQCMDFLMAVWLHQAQTYYP